MKTSQLSQAARRYNHPNLISINPPKHSWETVSFTFRPFTGHEPQPSSLEPDYHKYKSLTPDEQSLLAREYRAADIAWGKARFRLAARPLLTAAVPVWKRYAKARAEMDAIYAGFDTASDAQWRSRLLALTRAHDAALAAAQAWDNTARGLAELENKHLRAVGEGHEPMLRNVAPECGVDVTGWLIIDDYRHGSLDPHTPLVRDVRKVIEDQRTRLKAVAELASACE